MKSFLVISDTHGRAGYLLETLIPVMNECDFIVHLGDGAGDLIPYRSRISSEILQIKGNCDPFGHQKELTVDTDAGKLLFLHGNGYRVKSGDHLELSLYAQECGCKYVFFGHTHIAEETEYGGVTLINPGSLGNPRCGRPSYCVAYIVGNKIVSKIVSI